MSPQPSFFSLLTAGIFASSILSAAESAPSLDFRKWQDDEIVRLDAFAGKIVVLDFFAHWCVPCLPTSQALEKEVREHYRQSGGNPKGIPVEVVGINIDQSLPDRTRFYVRKSGLANVLDDKDGKILKVLGGKGIPYIVVLDGRRSIPEKPDWQVAGAFTGFDGADPVRDIIDRIGGQAELVEQVQTLGGKLATSFFEPPQSQLLEASMETLRSDAVDLLDTSFRYRRSLAGFDIDISISRAEIDIGYQPPPAPYAYSVESPLSRSERMISYQMGIKETGADPLLFNVSGGYYDGYADFRSVWIDERFRQINHTSTLYRTAEPRGWNLAGGTRWEYFPASGFAQFDLVYQSDVVSPGYERKVGKGLVRGINELETWAGSLGFENALTSRIRTLHQFSSIETTARKPRFSYQGSLNYAAGEDWVWRPTFGLTKEDPNFTSITLGLTTEYELDDAWALSLSARHYDDTGEIEDVAVISSAAPPMDALQLGVGIRWTGDGRAFRVQVGHYRTRYDEPGSGQVEYYHLYQDRNWLYLESSFSLTF